MKYLSNAFSLNMINVEDFTLVRCKKVDSVNIPIDVVSIIGHQDTANIVSSILGFNVPMNRTNLKITKEDTLYVAQYIGPRLEEGSTTLPEGASISFFEIKISEGCENCNSSDCNLCSVMNFTHGI